MQVNCQLIVNNNNMWSVSNVVAYPPPPPWLSVFFSAEMKLVEPGWPWNHMNTRLDRCGGHGKHDASAPTGWTKTHYILLLKVAFSPSLPVSQKWNSWSERKHLHAKDYANTCNAFFLFFKAFALRVLQGFPGSQEFAGGSLCHLHCLQAPKHPAASHFILVHLSTSATHAHV